MNLSQKIRLLLIALLSIILGTITVFISLFSYCYDGCTVSGYFEDTVTYFPESLINLAFLTSASLLNLMAVYLFVSIFASGLTVRRWHLVLLTIALVPPFILALFGLFIDSGDAPIYGAIVGVAFTIALLLWSPSGKGMGSHVA